MKPHSHAAVSVAIGGAVWGSTQSPYAMVSAVATGLLVDLDHLVEYYWWFVKGDRSRVFFFLHSYELLAPGVLAIYLSGWDPMVIGVMCAFLGHLLSDQLVNPIKRLGYFWTYRSLKGFRRSEIITAEWSYLEGEFLGVPGVKALLRLFNPRVDMRS